MTLPSTLSEQSAQLCFALGELDRRADLRDDATALAALAADPRARVVAICGPRVVVRRDATGRLRAGLDFAEARAFAGPTIAPIFLGVAEGVGWFALARPSDEGAEPDGIETIDLRALALDGTLPAPHLGALATARALSHWHEGHAFCSRCGTPSRVASAGWKRICPTCGAEHFPRTDPVVIMSVERGDRCLLGRGPHFPEGMWSCLAGFMEPGETIEAAVRREILEEAGVTVGRVDPWGSQPWPFPGSLMIGLRAIAESETIRMDPVELADCRWFDRAEVRLLLERRHPDGLVAPPPIAIAHHLLSAFVAGA